MHKEWLTRKTTAAEVEATVMDPDHPPESYPVPLGPSLREWQRLAAQMRPGDELWEFCSPPETWEHLAGRAGLALVRDGAILDTIIMMVN